MYFYALSLQLLLHYSSFRACSVDNISNGETIQRFSPLTITLFGSTGSNYSIKKSGLSLSGTFDTNGYGSISLGNMNEAGIIELNIICDTAFTLSLNVDECKSSFSFDNTVTSLEPTLVSETFTFSTMIKSVSLNNQHHGTFICTLEILNSSGSSALDKISPSQSAKFSNLASCSFTFQFTEEGTYTLSASVKEVETDAIIISDTPKTVKITDSPSSITITSTMSVAAAGSLVTYVVNLYKGNQLWTSASTVILSLDDSSSIGGENSKTTSTGIIVFRSSISTTGTRIITAKIGSISGSAIVTIIPLKFKIEALTASNSIPTTSNDIFSIVVTASDPSNTLASPLDVPITVSLIAPMGGNSGLKMNIGSFTTSSGSINCNLVAGTLSLNNAQILSSGVFKLGVSYSSSATTFLDFVCLNITNFIKAAALSQIDSISVYLGFQLSVDLIGTDDNAYLGTRSINVTESSLLGEKSAVSANGQVVWSFVYFTSIGPKSLVLKTNSSSDQLTALNLNVVKAKMSWLMLLQLSISKSLTVTPRILGIDQSLFDDNLYDPDYLISLLIFYADEISTEEDFLFLYSQYIEFFTNNSVDEQVFNVLLDSTIALFGNSYALTRSNSQELGESEKILLKFLEDYSELITDSQITKIFRILEFEIDQRDSQTAIAILELVSKINIKNKPIGYEIYAKSAKISFFRHRNTASNYLNTTFEYNRDNIHITEFPLNKEGIYDLFYVKHLQSETNFDISVYQTGSFNSLNYNRNETETLVNLDSGNLISLTVADTFNSKKAYKCVYFKENDWVSGGCDIVEINQTYAVVTLDHLSSFRIEIDEKCGIGKEAIVTIPLIVGFIIVTGIILYVIDKNVDEMPKANSLFIYYPLTSLCFHQPNARRSMIVFQLLSSQLLMVVLIGYFHQYFDSQENDNKNGFKDFYVQQLVIGAFGWVFTQIYTIPVFMLNAIALKRKCTRYVSVPLMGMITIGSIAVLSFMAADYCGGWAEYWLVNFLIFFVFDLAAAELSYALMFACVVRRSTEDSDFTTIKVLEVSSIDIQGKCVVPSHESVNLRDELKVDGQNVSRNRSRSSSFNRSPNSDCVEISEME